MTLERIYAITVPPALSAAFCVIGQTASKL